MRTRTAPTAACRRRATDRLGWPVWRLAWVIVFGTFASGLDASLVNVGLDTISTSLHARLTQAQWIASGYLLAFAMSLPLVGWLGRRVGVGRLWIIALSAFTIASGVCALVPDMGLLIGARVLQGLAGGLLIPAGQAVIGRAAGADRLGRVMATLGVAVAAAPALGPVVGGVILHVGSWRWLFAINLPIGAAGVALGARYVPRDQPRSRGPLDWRALAYIGVGLPLLVYGLTMWGQHASPLRTSVYAPLAAGMAGIAAFTLRTHNSRTPLIDLRLFHDRVFSAATAASGLTGMLMFGSGVVLPLYFQLVHGDSAEATGAWLLASGGATTVTLPLTGRLVDRYGGGVIAVIGTTLAAAATTAFALLPRAAGPLAVAVLLALFGVAVALAAVPPGIAAYKTVDADRLTDATTTLNIVQRVGGSLSGALFTTIMVGADDSGHVDFRATFAVMAVASLVGLATALWLTAELRLTHAGNSRVSSP